MLQRLIACALVTVSVPLGAVAAAQWRPGGRLRIVLLVDSSTAVGPMLTQFRTGLKLFLEELPGDPEIAFISTGGQFRMRVAPTADRQRLLAAAEAFAPDGGANTLLNTMLEADRRILKSAVGVHPVFVIVTTDAGETSGEFRVGVYNTFVRDFLQRGGRAHAVIIHGLRSGSTTAMVENLVENTSGFQETIALASALPKVMRTLIEWVAADQQ